MPTLQERVDAYISRKLEACSDIHLDAIASSIQKQNRFGRRIFLAWFQDTHPGLHSLLRKEHPGLFVEVPLAVTYTTATPNYDGFGTETVEFDAGTLDKKMLRKVETPVEHVTWQRCRYESGLQIALNEAQYQHVKSFPWFAAPSL